MKIIYSIFGLCLLFSCHEGKRTDFTRDSITVSLCENEQFFINAADSFYTIEVKNVKSSQDFFDSIRESDIYHTIFRIKHEYFNKEDSSSIVVYIPILFDEYDCMPVFLNHRSVFEIRLNSKNQLLVEGEYCTLDTLRILLKTNILNFGTNPSYANDPKSAVINFRWEVDSIEETISNVYNSIVDVYLSIAREESQARFRLPLCELPKDSILLLKEEFPIQIRHFKYQRVPPPIIIESIVVDELLLLSK